MAFVWDPEKSEDTFRMRKIKFEDAVYVFNDPYRIKRRDDDSSIYEERYQTIGMVGELLFVVYSEDYSSDDTRIISARLAEPKERRIYHEIKRTGKNNYSGWEQADT